MLRSILSSDVDSVLRFMLQPQLYPFWVIYNIKEAHQMVLIVFLVVTAEHSNPAASLLICSTSRIILRYYL